MINNACCYDNGGNDEPGTKDCLDKWKEQLEKVSNQYTESSARTSKHKEEYVNSLNWEGKLKNWDTIIKKSDEKSKTIVKELEFFLEQTKNVCENSKGATSALEKLAGLIKSIFDSFFTYDQNKEGLKEKITNFKKMVECLNSVSDEDKIEVIKCIETYEQKMILVCDMQDAILSHLLETLKQANLLSESICGNGGLEDKLQAILDDFKGDDGMDCEHEDHHPSEAMASDAHDDTKEDRRMPGEGYPKYPCNDRLVKPKPKFPINSSKYYREIEKGLKRAVEKTKDLEEIWVASKKESDKILSHKTSLTEAIKAAEAAESGK